VTGSVAGAVAGGVAGVSSGAGGGNSRGSTSGTTRGTTTGTTNGSSSGSSSGTTSGTSSGTTTGTTVGTSTGTTTGTSSGTTSGTSSGTSSGTTSGTSTGTTTGTTTGSTGGPGGGLPAPANDYQEIIGIAVPDVTAPVVTLDSRSVQAQGPKGARIDYTATAVDAVDGPLPVTCDPAPGSLFPRGATKVTCTATDRSGNTGSATATFTVLPAPVPDRADLAVRVGIAPAPTYTGARTFARITLTNTGPRSATGVVVTSGWPHTTAGKSSVAPLPACTTARPCTIPPGGRMILLQPAVYHVPLTGKVHVRVKGEPADPHAADNTATALIRVVQPELTVTPAVARPGDVVVARGTGFPPGTTVPLSWSRGITPVGPPALVGPDGTFEAQVVIVPKDQSGPRDLLARPTGYDPLSRPVLVVQRAVQPPDFAARG